MAWNRKIRLIYETQHCTPCGNATRHWKVVSRLGGLSKVMAYTGGVVIPVMQRAGDKFAKWHCCECDPLSSGYKDPNFWRRFTQEMVDKLLRDGEA